MNPRNDEQAIAEAEHTLAAAHLTLDLDTIDRLLHPSYVNLQPDGTTESKAERLASLRSRQRHWDHAAARSPRPEAPAAGSSHADGNGVVER